MQGWMKRGMHAREWEGRKVKGWWDEWVVGKIGYPASKSQDHFWREVQDPPAPFTFRSRCCNSSRTQGRPRKTKDSPKEVLLPDLHSELPLLHLCWDPRVEQ